MEWAQCDKCDKWRCLPAFVKASTLPDFWECSMNKDYNFNRCSVPENLGLIPKKVRAIQSLNYTVVS